MLPGIEMLACTNLAVAPQVMQHIVQVESGANPFAIGVVNGQLVRQPRNIDEALATTRMLDSKGYNFSVGIAQVNRANLRRYGLDSYRKAFDACANLAAGAHILADCYISAHGDWGKAFSCYYSGNFVAGFRDGYVQKVYASISNAVDKSGSHEAPAIALRERPAAAATVPAAVAGATRTAVALRPVSVYATDSTAYRVALRRIAINTGAAALAPTVVSALRHPTRTTSTAADASHPDGDESSAADHVKAEPAGLLPTADGPLTAPQQTRAESADDVFTPQVRGPRRSTERCSPGSGEGHRHIIGRHRRSSRGAERCILRLLTTPGFVLRLRSIHLDERMRLSRVKRALDKVRASTNPFNFQVVVQPMATHSLKTPKETCHGQIPHG